MLVITTNSIRGPSIRLCKDVQLQTDTIDTMISLKEQVFIWDWKKNCSRFVSMSLRLYIRQLACSRCSYVHQLWNVCLFDWLLDVSYWDRVVVHSKKWWLGLKLSLQASFIRHVMKPGKNLSYCRGNKVLQDMKAASGIESMGVQERRGCALWADCLSLTVSFLWSWYFTVAISWFTTGEYCGRGQNRENRETEIVSNGDWQKRPRGIEKQKDYDVNVGMRKRGKEKEQGWNKKKKEKRKRTDREKAHRKQSIDKARSFASRAAFSSTRGHDGIESVDARVLRISPNEPT